MTTRLIDIMAEQLTTDEMPGRTADDAAYEDAYNTMVQNAREVRRQFDTLCTRNAALVAMLRELQTCIPDVFDRPSVCPVCWQHRQNGHTPDCRLAALIREGEKEE